MAVQSSATTNSNYSMCDESHVTSDHVTVSESVATDWPWSWNTLLSGSDWRWRHSWARRRWCSFPPKWTWREFDWRTATTAHTHTHGPQQLSINQSTEIQVTARRRQLVIQPTWAYCLTAVISSLTELFQAVANTVTDSSICWQRPITWLQTVMTNLYNN